MKTNKWMLSVAMFAIAIVGAFAISSTAPNTFYYRSTDPIDPCKEVMVECDQLEGSQCRVNSLAEGVKPVWEDLGCFQAVTHSEDVVLPEIPEF